MAKFNVRNWLKGRATVPEKLSDTPIALPTGADTPPDIHELIKLYIRQEVHQHRARDEQGEPNGTFDEEDDFEADDNELELPDLSRYQLMHLLKDETPPIEAARQVPQEGLQAPAGGGGASPADNDLGPPPKS